jgi:preprotein translocase subunit SecD
MYKNLRWKLLSIAVVTGLCVWSFTPPSQKIRLGLDLQGGLHLVLRVHTDDAIRAETETAVEQMRAALKEANVPVTSVRTTGLSEFTIEGIPTPNDQQFRRIGDDNFGAAFDREHMGGGVYTMRMKVNVVADRRREAVTQALQTIDRRVNELGVSENVVAPYGPTDADQIVVQLPGKLDTRRAEEIIRNTAQLKLQIVETGPMSDRAALLQPSGGNVPDDMEVVPGTSTGPDATQVFYLLRKSAAVTGADLRTARPTIDDFNLPAISFTLKQDSAAKFARLTESNIGRGLAIVLDGRVVSAPNIETRIEREGRITGRFTQQEAADLALVLRSGALPASLTYLEKREVGPTLGADSIRAGVTASIIGLILVTLFMLSYYKLAGINAFVSITLNLVILLGCMAYLGAVMTLPGIAGFILTIGMGVDSNVLIFERIREELQTKKSARPAIAAGFDRVFITIIDTHVASLIAAGFLFQFGTGPIRGFATTLFFGLISNVFTAVFVSRTVFELILSRKPAGATELSI